MLPRQVIFLLIIFLNQGEGKAYKAYEVLKDSQSNANRYKFALTCLKLNKLQEAEKALLNKKTTRTQEQNPLSQVPNGAAGLYLLGLICERQIKRKDAIEHYSKALMMDPTLWCAFERLSKLQMNVDPNKIFTDNHQLIQRMNAVIREYMQGNIANSQFQQSPSQSNLQQNKSPNIIQKSPAHQDMKENLSAKKKQQLNITSDDINNEDELFQNELKTPTGQTSGQYITPTSNMNIVPKKQLGQNAPSQVHHASRIMNASGLNMGAGQSIQNAMQFQLDETMQAQSLIFPSNNIGDPIVKPFTISTPNLQTLQTSQNQIHQINIQSTPLGGAQVSSFDANQQVPGSFITSSEDRNNTNNKNYLTNSNPSSTNKQKPSKDQKQQQQQLQIPGQPQQQTQLQQFTLQNLISTSTAIEIQDLMSLMKVLGHAFLQLCLYKCQEAIKIFGKLTKKQYQTGWVLSQVAKCYFEMSKYQEAEKVYRKVTQIEPYRLEGLEYYSTCLWHLKKQVELCKLSNQALETSLFAPETWCVVGNCYSLQKEHETALKFFSRAIQLNSNFAYAHTLCGHEYVANEDFDSAKKCYQRALASDERHYNAWWGLGNICLKQEKFEQAANLFQSAIQINSRSSVLYTYMGMTKHNCNQPNDALQWFEKSEQIDKENSLNKFQKANVLIALDRHEEALSVLLDLMNQVPKEAPIHIVIGKIYKKMGNVDKALQHFTKALDLDPKDTNMVKSLIDKIHSNNDINDDADIQIL